MTRIPRRELLAGGSAAAMLTILMPALARPPIARGEHPRAAGRGRAQTITIANRSGTAQTNYPLQFGRPFVSGEIAHYPQVLINGTPVQTQADVKNRHSDGSVKYAVIALIVPSIPISENVTLSFQDQVTGNNTPLSKNDMLHAAYDFDAV